MQLSLLPNDAILCVTALASLALGAMAEEATVYKLEARALDEHINALAISGLPSARQKVCRCRSVADSVHPGLLHAVPNTEDPLSIDAEQSMRTAHLLQDTKQWSGRVQIRALQERMRREQPELVLPVEVQLPFVAGHMDTQRLVTFTHETFYSSYLGITPSGQSLEDATPRSRANAEGMALAADILNGNAPDALTLHKLLQAMYSLEFMGCHFDTKYLEYMPAVLNEAPFDQVCFWRASLCMRCVCKQYEGGLLQSLQPACCFCSCCFISS